MKITTTSGKHVLSISKAEWLKIGQQFGPQSPQEQEQTYDQMMGDSGTLGGEAVFELKKKIHQLEERIKSLEATKGQPLLSH